MNHTSDQHPWFQQARRDRRSRYRHFYVWSDEKQAQPSEVAFPGEQDSTWTYDDMAGQWYMHRYYDFMPDLNITDPDVRDEMNKVLGFWLELGVSGFRVNSLPFMIETVGTGAREQPISYLRSQVEFLGRRRGDAIFLGEANVSPQEQERYFAIDDGDGVQMLFDFRTCAAQWLAHARGHAGPLVDSLNQRPRIPVHAQFANFVRHHDELNLGLLSDAERGRCSTRSRPNRGTGCTGAASGGGWPRCWVTTGAGSRWRWPSPWPCPARPSCCTATRSAWARTCPCPADSPSAARCNGHRGTHGGFSAAATPYRPVRADGPYGYRTVNVASQRHDPGSLYSWVAHAIAVRRQCPELGWGEWRTLKVSDPRVLAIETRWRGSWSRCATCPAGRPTPGCPATWPAARPAELRQLLADSSSPAAGPGRGADPGGRGHHARPGYGYRWPRLTDDSRPGLTAPRRHTHRSGSRSARSRAISAFAVGSVSISHRKSWLVEPQELPEPDADHGGEASVAVAAAPVPRGELTEVIPRADGAQPPAVDEHVKAPGDDEVERAVRVPPAGHLLSGRRIETGRAGADGP